MSDPFAGLYLHIPFCSRVCPYCDFAVRTGDSARRRRFADDLCREIELHADCPLHFDTIYFGGGTPSRLDAEELARIVESVRRHLQIVAQGWILLEANPEDVTVERLAQWRDLGVATLSLGVQSFDAAALEFLGRRHGPELARRSIELALRAGFHTVSIDLIYGLPGQREAAWREQMSLALAAGPQHLSCYQLTIDQGTRFALLEKRGRLSQLPQDAQAELFLLTHRFLNDAGMQGYEVSQFATAPEHRSPHNVKYWNHTPYLGLGPSAHSFDDNRRWWNYRRTDPWQACVREGRRPIEGRETLAREELVLEALMTGLRSYAGVDLRRVRSTRDVDLLEANRSLVERLSDDGLLTCEGERLVPTARGLALADSIAARFDVRTG